MILSEAEVEHQAAGRPSVLSKNEYRWIPDQEAEEQICVPSEMIRYMSLISKPSFGVSEDANSK